MTARPNPAKPPALPVTSLSLHELLDSSAWFPRLDAAAQRQVLADITELQVSASGSLSRYGETQSHWFGVMEGLLKWCTTSEDGRAVTFGGLSAGSWFGEATLLRGSPRKADIVALRHSRVAALPRETFLWLHATQLAFNHFLLQQINERLHWFMDDYAAHRLLDTDHQVARALVGLFHPWLYPRGDRHLHISQEEIAQLSGVSRQRCNAALNRLKNAGYIRIEYGGITVLDLHGLRGEVDAHPAGPVPAPAPG